jgi:predicted regulator of Ras-like GTPase activity (Roadblock/LC7/MglB family)
MSSVEQIDSILQNIESEVPSVQGAVIASRDGFVITHTLTGEDAEEIAAMVATTTGVSERMAATLSAGDVDETSISAADRSVFLYRAGQEGVLALIAGGEANVGMINLQARRATEEIESLLADPSSAAA